MSRLKYEELKEPLIVLSLGFGKTLAEAETASKRAKKQDLDLAVEFPGRYAISREPESLPEDSCIEKTLEIGERQIQLMRELGLEEHVGYRDLNLTCPQTGLYNRAGLGVELIKRFGREKLSERRWNPDTQTGTVYVFADGDGMKALNDRFGSQYVDDLISIVGKSWKDSFRTVIRKGHEKRELDIPICSRVNSTGDEFMAILNECKYDYQSLGNIANRIFKNTADSQREFIKEHYSSFLGYESNHHF